MNILKTKTFWTGLASILAALSLFFTEGKKEEALQLGLQGLAIIFLRDAIRKKNDINKQE